MKASLLCLVLSWLPSLAAQAFETEHLERAVPPLELAAVSFTPTAPSTFSPSTSWGYVPLPDPSVVSALPSRIEPVVTGSWHAPASQLSIADLFKRDPLGVTSTRSHVPELTTTALWGTIALAALVLGQAVRRQVRSA